MGSIADRRFRQSCVKILAVSFCRLAMSDVGQAFVPPSTVRFAPVMYDASGPATNATNAATSSPFAEVSTLRSAGGFLSDPVRAQIYAEMATSECPLNCSNFREVDNRTLSKLSLSHH